MRPILPKPSNDDKHLGVYQRVEAKRACGKFAMLIPAALSKPDDQVTSAPASDAWRKTPVPTRVRCSNFSKLHFFPTIQEDPRRIPPPRTSHVEQLPPAVAYVLQTQSMGCSPAAEHPALHTSMISVKSDPETPTVYTNQMYRNLYGTEVAILDDLKLKQEISSCVEAGMVEMEKEVKFEPTDLLVTMPTSLCSEDGNILQATATCGLSPKSTETKEYLRSKDGNVLPRDLDDEKEICSKKNNTESGFQRCDLKQEPGLKITVQPDEKKSSSMCMNAVPNLYDIKPENKPMDTDQNQVAQGYVAKITVGVSEGDENQVFYWTHVPTTKAAEETFATEPEGNELTNSRWSTQNADSNHSHVVPKECLKGDTMQVAIAQRAREQMKKRKTVDNSSATCTLDHNGGWTFQPAGNYRDIPPKSKEMVKESAELSKESHKRCSHSQRGTSLKRKDDGMVEVGNGKHNKKQSKKPSSRCGKKNSSKPSISQEENDKQGCTLSSAKIRSKSDGRFPQNKSRQDQARKRLSESLELQLEIQKIKARETDAKLVTLQVFLEQQQKKLEEIRGRRLYQS